MSEKRSERLQIMLTADEARALDTWRFDHRVPSRSAAARALMNIGLSEAAEESSGNNMLERGIASADIGILKADTKVLDDMTEGGRGRILIAHPSVLTALALKCLVVDAGFDVAATVHTLDNLAAELKQSGPLTAVVLDSRYEGSALEKAFLTRPEMKERVIVTLADDGLSAIPDGFHHAPRVADHMAPSKLVSLIEAYLQTASAPIDQIAG